MTHNACIFDMDGVLVHSGDAHFASWQALGSELGVPFDRGMFDRTFGMHNNQILDLWLARDLGPEEQARLGARKEELYRAAARDVLQAIPGVVELVRRLHDADLWLAVGSSGPLANIRMVLEILGLEACFRAIASGDDVSHGKPHPGIFLHAAERLGLPNASCLVFEDAPQGVAAAHAAGSPVVAITTTRSRAELANATMVIDSFDEIPLATVLELLRAAGPARTVPNASLSLPNTKS